MAELKQVSLNKLFIANRGEIALRIARTAREIGWHTVGVYAADDEMSPWADQFDALVRLEARGVAAYLDGQALIDIARVQGCSHLHPGYGFLSENAGFAQAVGEAGLHFVGPAPETLARLGDKASARALAQQAGVPVIPGSEILDDAEAALGFFNDQAGGLPIMLKAVAGGGGRGMRRVDEATELAEAFARCASEAHSAFGDGRLYAEAVIQGARHIEVQLIGDGQGSVSHLWERECSLQRRHQKLVEIAPAPGLDPALRQQALEHALAIGSAAGLASLATVEFLLGADGQLYFLEVNPRLQVEHTVTEEVTGLDLVGIQLALAEGKSLSDLGLSGTPPEPQGFAVQFRLNAEVQQAEGGTRPASGTLRAMAPPRGRGIRLESALLPGDRARPAYDPMVAKLIVHAPGDWAVCAARARRALSEMRLDGLDSNLALHRALAARPEFDTADWHTASFAAWLPELLAAAERLGNQDTANAAEPVAPAADLPAGSDGALSPMTATVVDLLVAVGAAVRAGQEVAIVEAMKMEHPVQAPVAGTVTELLVSTGDVVAEGAPLIAIAPGAAAQAAQADLAEMDLDLIRPDLQEVYDRLAALEDAARPEAVERRASRGQRTARANLHDLMDEGSFMEYGGLAIAARRSVESDAELRRKTPTDGIITGVGTVNADLFGPEAASVAALLVDATVMAGTQGHFHHKKIDRILDVAAHNKLPVVFYPEGGGGRPNDFDGGFLRGSGLTTTSFGAFARLTGIVPRLAVVSGFCFAGSASFAGMADTIIATKDSWLGMGGPAMIEGGGLGVFHPKEVGPIEVQAPNGVVDIVAEDEAHATNLAKRYLSYFQGTVQDWECADQRLLRHLIPENRRRAYDMRQVIDALCDTGSVLELRQQFAKPLITCLVRIEGRPFGLMTNDPSHLGGALDADASDKGAHFLALCDTFGLPVISLCDTPGFMVGPEIETEAHVRKSSRLFLTAARLTVPLFCLITRKAYGLGAQGMAGGYLGAGPMIASWPTGELGPMGLEGAVQLGHKTQIEAIEDPAERDAYVQAEVDKLYERGKALNSARALDLDAMIDPADSRGWIMRSLYAAQPIRRSPRQFLDAW